MITYNNYSGTSNVQGYEIGSDYVEVWFWRTPGSYVYSYVSAGVAHVEEMKRLALEGRGLNGYINRYVRNDYERRYRNGKN